MRKPREIREKTHQRGSRNPRIEKLTARIVMSHLVRGAHPGHYLIDKHRARLAARVEARIVSTPEAGSRVISRKLSSYKNISKCPGSGRRYGLFARGHEDLRAANEASHTGNGSSRDCRRLQASRTERSVGRPITAPTSAQRQQSLYRDLDHDFPDFGGVVRRDHR